MSNHQKNYNPQSYNPYPQTYHNQHSQQNWSNDPRSQSYQNNSYQQNGYQQRLYADYYYPVNPYQQGYYYGYQEHKQYPQNYPEAYPQQQANQKMYQNPPSKPYNPNQSQYYQQYPDSRTNNTSKNSQQQRQVKKDNQNSSFSSSQNKLLSQSALKIQQQTLNKSKISERVVPNHQKTQPYKPGTQTNTECRQIRKDVGLPSWPNPFRESSVKLDESKVQEYRGQQLPKPNEIEKNSSSLNNSFANDFLLDDSSLDHSRIFSNSMRSEDRGVQEVGRFGGAKKKQKRQNESIAVVPPQPVKKKEKSLAEEASNIGYFTVKTEVIETVNCPFDPSHVMTYDRLLTHISRCKQKCETASQYVMCPYDPTHYYRFDLIEAHKAACDKKHLYVVDDSWEFNTNTSIDQSTQLGCDLTGSKVIEELPLQEDKSHQVITEDPQRLAFENLLITDF